MKLAIVLIIVILILLVIGIVFNTSTYESFTDTEPIDVWTYWDTLPGRTKPVYIDLCLDTFKNVGNRFRVHILNKDSVKQYLPELRPDLYTKNILLAQKVDYIRLALLYKYGGIWLDADTIVMRNLDEIADKLQDYDFVGFGCTGVVCTNGYPKPSNWALASRKNSVLMKACLDQLDAMLDSSNSFDYHDFGKHVIWKQLEELLSKGYNYYHFGAEYEGSRDSDGHWIHTPNHLSHDNTKFLDESKLLFIFLENHEICSNPDYKWFTGLTKDQVLQGKWMISRLFRKALYASNQTPEPTLVDTDFDILP